jgi:hypothetical protein
MEKLNEISEWVLQCTKENRKLDGSQVTVLGKFMSDHVIKYKDVVTLLGLCSCSLVKPNSEHSSFWTPFGCVLLQQRQFMDAYLVWHVAAKASESSKLLQASLSQTEKRSLKRTVMWKADNASLLTEKHKFYLSLRNQMIESCFPELNMIHRVRELSLSDFELLSKMVIISHNAALSCNTVTKPYHIFNPSILRVPNQDRLIVNLRCANYEIRETNGRYHYVTPNNKIQTINYLASVDLEFKDQEIREANKLKQSHPMPYPRDSITGLEDIRLFHVDVSQNKLYFTCTSLEIHPQQCPQIALGCIDLKKNEVEHLVHCKGPYPVQQCPKEKNWVPFEHQSLFFAIYSFQPLTVVKLPYSLNPANKDVKDVKDVKDSKETKLKMFSSHECPIVCIDACPVINEWRGSTNLLELQTEEVQTFLDSDRIQSNDRFFLTVIHVSNFPKYGHKFVVVRLRPCYGTEDRPFQMQVVAHSSYFVFATYNIEFTCGLTMNQDRSEIILPYSVRDYYCYFCRIRSESLFKKLSTVPEVDVVEKKLCL